MKAISEESVRQQAKLIFAGSYPSQWWASARKVYMAEMASKREQQFFAIFDQEYANSKGD